MKNINALFQELGKDNVVLGQYYKSIRIYIRTVEDFPSPEGTVNDLGNKKILVFKGGPTGYESYTLNEQFIELIKNTKTNFCICIGTPFSYERCYVDSNEVRAFLIEEGIIPTPFAIADKEIFSKTLNETTTKVNLSQYNFIRYHQLLKEFKDSNKIANLNAIHDSITVDFTELASPKDRERFVLEMRKILNGE